MSIVPAPSPSRPWWSRSSVLSSKSSSDKQLPCSQGSKPSASKKLSTIATAIGLRPKKTATPVQEPATPILPLHTGDIETPPRPTKPAVKPVPVAVGWSDPRALQPEEFLDAYPQSVFSTDLDPFATAAKYSDGIPCVSDSLRFSTISEVSVLDPHLHQDVPHTHDRISSASSSSLSHHRSDITSDSSPISSPLLSPVMSGRHLSRLTVDSERMREHFPPSPASPQSLRSALDERSRIPPSPSSTTLTDAHNKGDTITRTRTRSRGKIDTGRSRTDPLLSDRKSTSSLKAASPMVIIRQPSSSRLQSLRPPTAPPASELPPAPGDVQPHDFSLLPAFVEPPPQSATSSSSSISFASSTSSKLDVLEVDVHRRDMRRLKDAKKSGKSRPTSPLKDSTRDVHDLTSKSSHSSREFSPTRTLRKAISIQSIPKLASGNSKVPSLSTVEDTKSMTKQRSFYYARIPRPSLPSLKQTGASNASGRDALPVPEEPKASVQLPQKSPLSSPVLSPTNVRRRLFSGTSLRCSLSPQTPDPDDDSPSIFSLPTTASPPFSHSTAPTSGSFSPNKQQLSSFWDDEMPTCPDVGNEPRDIGPRHILSAADILKFDLECEKQNGSVRSRESSITSPAPQNRPVRTAHDPPSPAKSVSSPSASRQFYSLGAGSSRSLMSGRQRTRGNSLRGKVGDVSNVRPQIGVTSLGQAVRSLSSQSLSSLPGLPQPPRQRTRPSTSSGIPSPTTEDVPLFTPGDRSSLVALMPLSPPPARRSAARPTLDHTASTPTLRPVVSRRPSFLDMRDDLDREQLPPDDSFLDMGKVSLDTVRSSMEMEPAPS